jgi:hypothetical protein
MRFPENGNMCTTKAGLAVGTTTTLTTANTQLYSLLGKAFTKAGVSNEATPTTDARTAAAFVAVGVSKGSVFVVCRDSGGNLKVCQGEVVGLDQSNAFQDGPEFPPIPDTLCPIGYILVKVGTTGSAWTFGTSNLAGPPTGVVVTYVDCFVLPDRPQTS